MTYNSDAVRAGMVWLILHYGPMVFFSKITWTILVVVSNRREQNNIISSGLQSHQRFSMKRGIGVSLCCLRHNRLASCKKNYGIISNFGMIECICFTMIKHVKSFHSSTGKICVHWILWFQILDIDFVSNIEVNQLVTVSVFMSQILFLLVQILLSLMASVVQSSFWKISKVFDQNCKL